jgi:hypothetical protein
MALTETFIRACDDDALSRTLADELSRRVPREMDWDTEGHLAHACLAAGAARDDRDLPARREHGA